MFHGFNLECAECGVKFCQCHKIVYFDDEIFCSEECKDSFKEFMEEEDRKNQKD